MKSSILHSPLRIVFKPILALLLCLIKIDVIAEELTPAQYFGDSYTEAVNFCDSNRANIKSGLAKYKIPVDEAIAIVFPEVIRYNRFSDFAETTALELAYVQGGKTYADFSIGRFQIKPSFVEMLEEQLLQNQNLLQQFSDIVNYSPNLSAKEIREERIKRLKQFDWQLKYLACFIKLSEVKYCQELVGNPQERLLILSSAYNRGLNSTYKELKLLSEKKTFPYGTSIASHFSYFDVANYFFIHSAHQTQNKNP
jgi:hypothetical protein